MFTAHGAACCSILEVLDVSHDLRVNLSFCKDHIANTKELNCMSNVQGYVLMCSC